MMRPAYGSWVEVGSTERPTSETAERRPLWRRRLLVGIVGAAVLLTGVLVAAWVTAPAPARPKQVVLGRLRDVGGRFVPLRAISPILQRAIVATEDERFYHHHGIDMIGLTRAFAYDASHLTLSQGGSTLTEQLAKILYLWGNDESSWRKLQVAAVVINIESAPTQTWMLVSTLITA